MNKQDILDEIKTAKYDIEYHERKVKRAKVQLEVLTEILKKYV